jgi:UPF0755 protein
LTLKRILLIAVLVAAMAVAAIAGHWWRALHQAAQRPGSATQAQTFEVPPGASLRAVLRQLEQQHLIGSARNLELYLRCCLRDTTSSGAGIKAGRYRIEAGQLPLAILQQLREGRIIQEQLTIVEGWTFAQMRRELRRHKDLLQSVGQHSDATIMRTLGAAGIAAEGRFAPDTYAYTPGVTTDLQILRSAFEAQRRNLADAWTARQPRLPLETPEAALALASIVEKETGLASERARVAGVYINRLRIGMRLQSDPSVIYGIGPAYDGNIRKRDLLTDTPYNTYTRAGLPPTAIALPGRDAIVATLNPERTDALYFVAAGDGSGGHYFSATIAEHNRAVRRYLERLHRQAAP